jgi:hypothetical protein
VKGRSFDKNFLRILLFFHLMILIPVLLRKPPKKDWVCIYIYNAVTNGFLDRLLTKNKIITYPVRLFPKLLKINVLFDFLVYPLIAVLYNQITVKDKPLGIFYKVLFFTVPIYLFEAWAVRETNLIKWHKGWKGYHSFIGLTVKSLLTRSIFAIFKEIRETP